MGLTVANREFDAAVAAWSRQQNHGVPPWHALDASAQAWWRDRYALHRARAHITEGKSSE